MLDLCVTRPIPTHCEAFGLTFDCALAWDPNSSTAPSVYWGQIVACLALWVVGAWNVLAATNPIRVVKGRKHRTKWATYNLVGYCFITGCFSLFRALWHNSRPLLMGAAIHNLFEWGWLCMFYQSSFQGKVKSFTASVMYIWGVIVAIILLQKFEHFSLVEQQTGLVLDFLTPLTHYHLWKNAKNEHDKTMWTLALAASTIHVCWTILPIVFMNFTVFQSMWLDAILEGCVLLATIITMILYTPFVDMYDNSWEDPKTNDTREEIVAHNFWWRYFGSLAVATMPLLVYPVVVGFCDSGYVGMVNVDQGAIVGTAVGVVRPGATSAWEDLIYHSGLIPSARSFDGNMGYSMMRDIRQPNLYRFVERWENADALQGWLKSSAVRSVFDDQRVKNLLDGGALQIQGGYHTLEPRQKPVSRFGAVTITFDNSCSAVWSVINDWSNCKWVYGCESCSVRKNERGNEVRTMIMTAGPALQMEKTFSDSHKMVLKYDILIPTPEYHGEIRLSPVDDNCLAVISSEISPSWPASLEEWYKEMESRSSWLQNQIRR